MCFHNYMAHIVKAQKVGWMKAMCEPIRAEYAFGILKNLRRKRKGLTLGFCFHRRVAVQDSEVKLPLLYLSYESDSQFDLYEGDLSDDQCHREGVIRPFVDCPKSKVGIF